MHNPGSSHAQFGFCVQTSIRAAEGSAIHVRNEMLTPVPASYQIFVTDMLSTKSNNLIVVNSYTRVPARLAPLRGFALSFG